MEVRCKCHGVSGSCELKTCWRAAPDFRVVGAALKDRFREAVMVEESNLGTGTAPLLIVQEGRRGGGRRQDNLIYYEKSPNFCERDAALEVSGTVGRQCRRTGRGVDSCASLCCGRGYNIVRRRRTDRCNCKFQWCCYVTCANCTVDEWITVCK
ncbi:hypothetical protein AAG570_000990 [Ranatra chinensis]|uniref:Protein Wnt n=1 Tax=Ranatra chinensis TaxID=642074 RepID=A0ABD0YAI4_9HEMI